MLRIQNLQDIFTCLDELYRYLERKDIAFDEGGFPIFRREMFLDSWPDLVVPYSQRHNQRVTDPGKTLLCFFEKDHNLYPRLGKILGEIDEYKRFMGITGLDITVTVDMDPEWERTIVLLNQLFMAVLAVNGIRIVLNTRTAGEDVAVLGKFPQRVMAASGFLGCDLLSQDCDFSYLRKILLLLPDKLILYGKHDKIAEEQLDKMGINYKVYTDFHRLCKEVHHGGQ